MPNKKWTKDQLPICLERSMLFPKENKVTVKRRESFNDDKKTGNMEMMLCLMVMLRMSFATGVRNSSYESENGHY